MLNALEPLTAAHGDAAKIFQATLNIVSQLIEVERVSILLLHAHEGFLRMRAALGIPEREWASIRIPVGVGVAGRLVEDRVPVLVADIRDSEFSSLARPDLRYGSQSFMAAPVIIHGKVTGVLCATGIEGAPPWRQEELDVLVCVAGYLARAVDGAQITQSTQASVSRIREVLATVSLGLVIVDLDGRVVMISAPARQMLRLAQLEEAEGRPLVELFDPQTSHALGSALADTLEFAAENTCQALPSTGHAEGGGDTLDLTIVPLVDENSTCTGALVTLTSRVLQSQVDELRRVNDLKTSFLATVSHEFRTPLTAINGAVYLLDTMIRDDNQRQLAAIIQRNTRRLNRLLENLIELMQIQNGSLQVSPEACNLASVVQEAVALLAEAAADRQIQYHLELADCSIWADPGLTRKVAVEIIDNAIKFSPVGATVRLTTGADEAKAMAFLQVTDAGPGVDANLRRSLFESIGQAQHFMTRNITGLGMGLNLAHQITLLQGGTLTELGKEGEGAVFRLTMPTLNTEERVMEPGAGAL